RVAFALSSTFQGEVQKYFALLHLGYSRPPVEHYVSLVSFVKPSGVYGNAGYDSDPAVLGVPGRLDTHTYTDVSRCSDDGSRSF
ncbi:hypothetical protein, partial [Sporisorium scitamineum]